MDKFTKAAIEVLKKHKMPLQSKTITEIALKEGILETSGKTPDESISSRISVDIKKNGNNSYFIRTKPGFYKINKEREIDKTKKGKLAENRFKIYTDEELRLIFSLTPTENNIKYLAAVLKREKGGIRQQYQWGLLTGSAIKRKGRNPDTIRCRKIAKEMGRIKTS